MTSTFPSFAPAKKRGHRVGKTKRGKGTKIMAIADRNGLPVWVYIQSATQDEGGVGVPSLGGQKLMRLFNEDHCRIRLGLCGNCSLIIQVLLLLYSFQHLCDHDIVDVWRNPYRSDRLWTPDPFVASVHS
jgi:hypothetical protein